MNGEGREASIELHFATRHQICVIRETLYIRYQLSTPPPSPVHIAPNAGIAIEYIGAPAVHFTLIFRRFYYFLFFPIGPSPFPVYRRRERFSVKATEDIH